MQPVAAQEDTSKRSGRLESLTALAVLAVLEISMFAPIAKRIGFYLDDWSMYANLHFGPQSLIDLTAYALKDDKVLIRPVEAPYFSLMHILFGASPFGHHLVNYGMEVGSAFFAFMAIRRITGSAPVSLWAAMLFLLYPTHDSTHYWLTASSATMSMCLYTASWWLSLVAARTGRASILFSAALLFFLSVFNYEAFIPLSALTAASLFLVFMESGLPVKASLMKAGLWWSPFLFSVGSMWCYNKLLIALGRGWTYHAELSVGHFIETMRSGFDLSLGPGLIAFLGERVKDALASGLNTGVLLGLAAGGLVALFSAYLLSRQSQAGETSASACLKLAGLGLLTMIASYTIYGVAPNYMPTLTSIINRINYGASLGAAMILAAGCAAAGMRLARLTGLPPLRQMSASLICASLVLAFILANHGLSQPWIASWTVQKHVRSLIEMRAAQFAPGDAILLANVPRYAMWSPVFDGVWDFQSMVWLVLDRRDVSAGVVSERMRISRESLKDISMGYLCGTYPFTRLTVLVPTPPSWLPVRSAEEFIGVIQKHGMGFGLDASMPNQWRKQLAEWQPPPAAPAVRPTVRKL